MNIKIDPEEGPSGLQSVTCHVDVPNYPGDQEAEAGGEYDEDYGDYFAESEAAAVGDETVMDDILSPSQQATNSESGMRKVRKDCKMPFASPGLHTNTILSSLFFLGLKSSKVYGGPSMTLTSPCTLL